MKKYRPIIIGLIVVILVFSIGLLIKKTNIFTNAIREPINSLKSAAQSIDFSRLFLYKNKVVSPVTSAVTSPVSSVVVSDVTSPGGTSRVASVVTSPVASAVASAVTVEKRIASVVDIKKLQNLTEAILRAAEKEDYRKNPEKFISAAQEDYRKNPRKFTLPESAKQKLIELYKQKYPSEFIFRPL